MIAEVQGTGPLTRIDPRLRVIAVVLLAGVVVVLERPPILLAAVALAALLLLWARVPPGAALRRLLAVDSLMLVVLLTVPFTVAGTPVAAIGPLVVSREGLTAAAAMLLRANAVLLAVLALVATLSPMHLGQALAALGLPAPLVGLLSLTARHVQVLADEFHRRRRAMRVRAFRPRANVHTWRSLAWLVGMLLVRGYERGERVEWAMRCRGYNGRMPPPEPRMLARSDLLFAGVALAVAAALLMADRP